MKNSLIILIITMVLLFTGCSRKTTIEPLVQNCCENKNIIKTNKKIYIGNFTLRNTNNIKNIYGTRIIKSDSEDIIFEENYNDIVRNELFKKLQKVTNNVQLVSQKPNSFNENDSIYIEGYIEKIWINQQVPTRQTKFNTNSIFDFKITSIVNKKSISDNFNAKLELIVQDIQVDIKYWTILLINYIGSEASQNIKHRLSINNELIADFNYFQYLGNPLNFTIDYELAIKGNIYGKYPQKLDDISKGNVNNYEIYLMPYSYLSPNLNTSPGYNFLSNANLDNYLSKDEINKIKEKYDLQKKEYDECISDKKSNENCIRPTTRNIETTKYYDIFRLYATNSGILQYMSNVHIDNIIEEINKN